MTALASRTYIDDPTNNANAEIGLLALWDVINEIAEKAELDIASASTCNIGAMASAKLRITGTTTITSFGTVYRGPILIRMAAALTITHNATTLVCPGNANIVTAAGDVLMAWPKTTTSGTSNGWQVAVLARGNGGGIFPGAVSMLGALSVTGPITPSQTKGIVGTTTNNDADAGSVGEYVTAAIASTSPIALVANATKNVTSISITAGDWDISGLINHRMGAATSVTGLFGGSSLVSNAADEYQYSHRCAAFVPGAVDIGYMIPTRRVIVSSPTTVYLVATAGFTGGTVSAWGYISARRVR